MSITCPKCGMTSYNPNDEREKYCGNCHQFHDEMKKMPDADTLRHYIDTILNEAEDKLTDWERSFLDSVDLQLTQKGDLTVKQAEIVERIYNEKVK